MRRGVAVAAVLLYWAWERGRIPTIRPEQLLASYDYIVVGAGSAGCLIAAELARDHPKRSVLLVEAGGDGHAQWWSHVPGAVPFNQNGSMDWAYRTEPQTRTGRGFRERRMAWPRGRVLGGTSVLNYMLHVWAQPGDYRRWVERYNLSEWDWPKVEPIYRELEAVTFDSPQLRGRKGPIKVTRSPTTTLGRALVEAARILGLPVVEDLNGGFGGEGFHRAQNFIYGKRRQSSVEVFLRPAASRDNLHILVDAHVTRLLVSSSKAAEAVELIHSGQTYVVRARKEIILSAGAIGSPHILLLSGIGPAEELAQHGIPVKADLPAVGRNLWDHNFAGFIYRLNQSIGNDKPMSFSDFAHIALTFLTGTTEEDSGMLGGNGIEYFGHFATGLNKEQGVPDVQLYFFPYDPTILHELNLQNLEAGFLVAQERGMRDSRFGAVFAISLQQPRSRGRIRLVSSEPLQYPSIDPAYYADETDLEASLKGYQIFVRLLKQEPFARFNLSWGESIPGCSQPAFSEAFLRCAFLARTSTLYHPAGTCRMGREPGSSVVDEDFRVHGVSGLRVADASVFPDPITGNTHLPTLVFAQRLVHFLRRGL